MIIVETSIFTKQVSAELADDEYRLLQECLVHNPEIGKIIQGTGGIRKTRWGVEGRGKRGGVRIIYYWHVDDQIVLMLLMYRKNERDDLTSQQKAILRDLVKKEFK